MLKKTLEIAYMTNKTLPHNLLMRSPSHVTSHLQKDDLRASHWVVIEKMEVKLSATTKGLLQEDEPIAYPSVP
jgi:hypothetical protein